MPILRSETGGTKHPQQLVNKSNKPKEPHGKQGQGGRGKSRRGTGGETTNAPRNPKQDDDKPLPPVQYAVINGKYYVASVLKDGKYYVSIRGVLHEATTDKLPEDIQSSEFGLGADPIYVSPKMGPFEEQKLYPGSIMDGWTFDPSTRAQKEQNNEIWAQLSDKQKGEILYRQGQISISHELFAKGPWGVVLGLLDVLPSFGIPSGEYSDRDSTVAESDSLRNKSEFQKAYEENGAAGEYAQVRPFSFIIDFFRGIWNTAEGVYERTNEYAPETMEEVTPVDDESIAAGQGGGGEFNPKVRSIFGKDLTEDDYIKFYQNYLKKAVSKPWVKMIPEFRGMSDEDIVEALKGRDDTRFIDFLNNPQALTAYLSGKSEELIREKVEKDWGVKAYPVNKVEVYGKNGELIGITEFDAVVGWENPGGILKIYPDTDLSKVVIFDGKMGKNPQITKEQRLLWPILVHQGAQIEILAEPSKLGEKDQEFLNANPEILFDPNFTLDSQFKATRPK